jgi:hypothetical protein
MITREQAMIENVFHANYSENRWRRNGVTKTWKRNPEKFRIPVKCGLSSYGYITEYNEVNFHLPEDCMNK